MPQIADKSKTTPDDSCQRVVCCVMTKVEQMEIKRSRFWSILGDLIAIAVIVAFIPTIAYIASLVSQSGLASYLSLIITDSSYIFSHLTDWLLSITMVWPITGSIIVVSLLLILANSLRFIARYSASASLHERRLAHFASV